MYLIEVIAFKSNPHQCILTLLFLCYNSYYICSCVASAGVKVTQGEVTGILKTSLSNEWTLAMARICIPASANVACSSISTPTNQAACDPQSIVATAGTFTGNAFAAYDFSDTSGTFVGNAFAAYDFSTAATAGTFTGNAFAAYDFATNGETLTVVVDGSDVVIVLGADFTTVGSAASGITIAGAAIAVDGSNLKITSASTGSSSSITIKATSGTHAKALFGVGASVTGVAVTAETLTVIVDESAVAIALSANFGDLASAASGITVAGATIIVDGSFLKITSASSGSGSSITIHPNSGTHAKALFGVGVSVTGAAITPETLTVVVDGTAVAIALHANFGDLASAASGITIAGATIVVDGSFLKITSASTGSTSTITIKATSGTHAKALFGVGASVTGIATNLCTFSAPVIAQTAGVAVSQGGVVKGTLKTTLSGVITSIVVQTASAVTVLDNVDVTIGTGGTATVLVHANIATATNNGATTSVVIQTVVGVPFNNSATILIGTGPGAAVLAGNIATATKTKSAATVSHVNIATATQASAPLPTPMISVTRSAADPERGYTWSVTFHATSTLYDPPNMLIDVTTMSGYKPSGTVQTVQNGIAPLAGTFRMMFRGNNHVWHGVATGLDTSIGGDQYMSLTSPPIPWNATAKEMEQALEAMGAVENVDVVRSSHMQQGGGYTWTVTFKTNQGSRAGWDATRYQTPYGLRLDNVGNLQPMQVDMTRLAGTERNVHVSYLYNTSTSPIWNDHKIGFHGKQKHFLLFFFDSST